MFLKISKFLSIISFIFFFNCESSNKNKNQSSKKEGNNVSILDKKTYSPIFPFTNGNLGKFNKHTVNSKGIPLLNYSGKDQLYPITYTQAALAYYADFIETNNQESKNKFLNIADFIKKEAKQIKDFAVLQANFKVENYELKPPAASSMAQGFAIRVMIQAYS